MTPISVRSRRPCRCYERVRRDTSPGGGNRDVAGVVILVVVTVIASGDLGGGDSDSTRHGDVGGTK